MSKISRGLCSALRMINHMYVWEYSQNRGISDQIRSIGCTNIYLKCVTCCIKTLCNVQIFRTFISEWVGKSMYLKDIRNSGSNICNCVYLSYVCMLCIWKQLLQTVSCYCSALTTLAVGQVTASRSVQVNRRLTQVMLKFSPAPGNSVAHHLSVVLRMHSERALQLWLVITLQMWSTCQGNRHFFCEGIVDVFPCTEPFVIV